ncbi:MULTISPECIES: hypothetical protein [unclassified Paenibacillus]|uniref:hypothetical protein n=1 Tax=unclassified Paenibacillus TaxID=185978 RepID=UPI001C98951D|nr:hypothetical protein [Paenibacillus sp. DR312]QZN76195.1 hypothetical protein K5K90_02480 [Paenibacillus sp. DR312]
MYGHQIYRLSVNERATFLNEELKKEEYRELNQLANELMVDETDLREDMAIAGWYYIVELKRFVEIETKQAS